MCAEVVIQAVFLALLLCSSGKTCPVDTCYWQVHRASSNDVKTASVHYSYAHPLELRWTRRPRARACVCVCGEDGATNGTNEVLTKGKMLFRCLQIRCAGGDCHFRRARNIAKATFSFVMSVCPRGPPLLPLEGFSWKVIFRQFVEVIQVLSKSDKNDRYFTWRPQYIYDNISPNSS